MATLRDVSEDDLPIFFEHQREPEANRMAAFPARERDAFTAHWRTEVLASPEVAKKTILSGEEVAGHVVSWTADGRRLVGYWLGSAYWGRGIATAALAAFVRDVETSRPVHAWVAASNAASIRVLEKCGFRSLGGPVTGIDGVDEILMELGAVVPPFFPQGS